MAPPGTPSAVGVVVRSVSGNKTFHEKTVTYKNAPAISTGGGAASGPVDAGWGGVDVTSLIPGGAANVTLALTTDSPSELVFSSRESGGLAPRLELVTAAPVDSSPPVVSLTVPAAGSTVVTGTPTFSGGAGSEVGDLATVTVKVWAGSGVSGSPVQTLSTSRSGGSYSVLAGSPLGSGVYTARAEQSDQAGNTGLSSANTFTVSVAPVDSSPPVVSLTVPAAGSTVVTGTPTFSGGAGSEVGDLATVTVKVWAGSGVSGSPVQTLSTSRSGGSYSVLAGSPLGSGVYTARAEQSDQAGNTGLSSANTFTVSVAPVDSSPPVVSLTVPAAGSTVVTGTPTFSGGAGSEVGDLATVTVKVWAGSGVSGSPVQTLSTSRTGGSYSVLAGSPLGSGVYTARAEQSDQAGNTGLSSANTFTIETGAEPDTAITSGPSHTVRTGTATFTFSASIPGATFLCALDGAAFTPCASPKTYHVANGGHSIAVRAVSSSASDPTPAMQTWWADALLENGNFETSVLGWRVQDYVVPAWRGYKAGIALVSGGNAGDSAIRVSYTSGGDTRCTPRLDL